MRRLISSFRPRHLPHQPLRTQSPSSTTSLRLQPRPFSTTSTNQKDPEKHPHPQRAAQQDREKMNPEANEYSKSGTDNEAAGQDDAAFDPNITDPQHAKEKAGEGNEVNPLDASPANPEISQGTSEEEGGVKKKGSEGGGGRD